MISDVRNGKFPFLLVSFGETFQFLLSFTFQHHREFNDILQWCCYFPTQLLTWSKISGPLYWHHRRKIAVLFLKQKLILAFICHKSATTGQIDSYKVSISTLKPDPCNCVKTEIVESMAPPQQPHKRDTNFLGHHVDQPHFFPIRTFKNQGKKFLYKWVNSEDFSW